MIPLAIERTGLMFICQEVIEMTQENLILRCPGCGTRNRIPRQRIGDGPICGKCRAPLPMGETSDCPVVITDGSFNREVLGHQGTVLVDCWAPWCGPCRTVAPVLDQMASEYAGRLKITKLNVDENPATASQYGIQSIPTMLLFHQGKLVDRLVGALPKGEIVRHISGYL